MSALIWTTTPWTIPASRTIAVHSDLVYLAVKTQRFGSFLIAQNRLANVSRHWDGHEVLGSVQGSKFVGLLLQKPATKYGYSPIVQNDDPSCTYDSPPASRRLSAKPRVESFFLGFPPCASPLVAICSL